ncbi:MAG TPA: TolC family protein, partial [Bdellovibrionota bacterium]|nr:TolC family protein [Bdellovibrionota bacterium]
PAPSAPSESPTATKTVYKIADLVSLAETNNFELTKNRTEYDKAEADVDTARSKLLPKLSLESTNLYRFEPSTQWTSQTGLVIEQTLFNGGKDWMEFARGQAKRDRLKLSAQHAKEVMSLEVIKALAECSASENQLSAARKKLALLEQQFDIVNRQFRQGLKNQRDYQLLEADVELQRLSVEKLQGEAYTVYRDLEKVIGAEGMGLDESKVTLLTGEKILQLAQWKLEQITYNPGQESLELKALAREVDERELAYNQARLQYVPTLSLLASATYGTHTYLGTSNTTNPWRENLGWNSAVGVNLSWTLWDWGGVPAKVAWARADKVLEETRLNQKKVDVKSDFRSLKQSIERQLRILEVRSRVRDLEQRSFDNIQKEYREGRAGYLDLINALNRSVDSETNFQIEALSYFTSVAELFKLKGSLYDKAKSL